MKITIYCTHYLVVLLVLVVCSSTNKKASKKNKSFDFNCEDECGKYLPADTLGRGLHSSCSALKKSEKCQNNSVKTNRNKQRKRIDKVDKKLYQFLNYV